MRLVAYTVKSAMAIEILIQAAEHVRDFESDLCLDLVSELKPANMQFDQTLSEIVDIRQRVRFATSFVASLKAAKVGETLRFDGHGLEVINKGLEYIQDLLGEAITEPMWVYERDRPNTITLTLEQFIAMRQAVEQNVDRVDVATELLKEFRSF